jgi:hypothetical protein
MLLSPHDSSEAVMRYARILMIPSFAPPLIVFHLFVGGSALAGTQDGPVIALHVQAHTTKNECTALESIPCTQYNTTWPVMVPADVYLVVARAQDGPGVAALQCGITYNPAMGVNGGVDVQTWDACSHLAFLLDGPNGSWPASESGLMLIWAMDDCQRTVIAPDGVHAMAGVLYVYAYSPDVLQVQAIQPCESPCMYTGLGVLDCTDWLTYTDILPTAAGAIGFGGLPGFNPCAESIPVAPTTWGNLKHQFVK